MSISDKTKKSLENIGLTSYEIRSYTTLLKEGEINASETSEKSGVPYSKIYEILGALEEKAYMLQDKWLRKKGKKSVFEELEISPLYFYIIIQCPEEGEGMFSMPPDYEK